MAIANGITTARVTGIVTLFESVGFWQPGLELLEPLQSSRLKNVDSPDRGLSMRVLIEAGSGKAIGLASLLRRWRPRWLRYNCRDMMDSS